MRLLLLLLIAMTLTGCARAFLESYWSHAQDVAARGGFQPTADLGAGMMVRGFENGRDGPVLTVYLEGDGRPFLSRTRISADPSPKDPNALRLAILDPSSGPVAYLARPCHFPNAADPPCDPDHWLLGRFSAPVIAAVDAALDRAKRRARAERLRLVGYSGGGAVALLVAAQRGDVTQIVTVAGTLDHAAWTAYHAYTPLRGSLNPPDFRDALAAIPQIHFAGAEDAEIPPLIAESYMRRRPAGADWRLIIVPGHDHGGGFPDDWAEDWPSLARAARLAP